MEEQNAARWVLRKLWTWGGWVCGPALWRGSKSVMGIAGDLMLVLGEMFAVVAVGLAILWIGYSCWYWPRKWRHVWASEAEQLFQLLELEDEEKTAQQYSRIRVLGRRFWWRRLDVPDEVSEAHRNEYYDFLAGLLKEGFLHAYIERHKVAKAEKEDRD